jgi:hypothetical protein
MHKVRCERCSCLLSVGNPYYYRQDGIKLCSPCRLRLWVPEPVRGNAAPPMKERATVTHKQRHDKVAQALPVRKVCECDSPIPMDEDEADTCFRCNKRIPARAAG